MAMKPQHILQSFENLIHNLSIDLRYEKGDFIGGLCKVGNKDVFIVNNKLPVEGKIKLLARELNRLNLERIYIRPALRNIIEGNNY